MRGGLLCIAITLLRRQSASAETPEAQPLPFWTPSGPELPLTTRAMTTRNRAKRLCSQAVSGLSIVALVLSSTPPHALAREVTPVPDATTVWTSDTPDVVVLPESAAPSESGVLEPQNAEIGSVTPAESESAALNPINEPAAQSPEAAEEPQAPEGTRQVAVDYAAKPATASAIGKTLCIESRSNLAKGQPLCSECPHTGQRYLFTWIEAERLPAFTAARTGLHSCPCSR